MWHTEQDVSGPWIGTAKRRSFKVYALSPVNKQQKIKEFIPDTVGTSSKCPHYRVSVTAGVDFSQTSVICFCWGFSCCPYYRGVRYSGVSARRELTVHVHVHMLLYIKVAEHTLGIIKLRVYNACHLPN